MRDLSLPGAPGSPLRILAVGCHSDDIEIGCGGTLLRLLDEHPGSAVRWVVMTARDERASEARASAAEMLARAETSELTLHEFRDGYLPYCGPAPKEAFEELKAFAPDLIFTHQREDLHQDHRMVCELTWNTFRDHLILEYEIPKYDGDLGTPNVFAPLDVPTCRRKVDILMRHFGSQRSKRWFSEDLFLGLMRLRGMECGAESGHAEAFYGRKIRF